VIFAVILNNFQQHSFPKIMTTLLSEAIHAAEALPEAAQNELAEKISADIAQLLTTMQNNDEDETSYLLRSPTNRTVLLQRIADIERGENLVIPDQSQFE
jgi:hypothetical protein